MARWWRTIWETAVANGEELERGDEDAALRTLLDGVNQLPGAAADGELTENPALPWS